MECLIDGKPYEAGARFSRRARRVGRPRPRPPIQVIYSSIHYYIMIMRFWALRSTQRCAKVPQLAMAPARSFAAGCHSRLASPAVAGLLPCTALPFWQCAGFGMTAVCPTSGVHSDALLLRPASITVHVPSPSSSGLSVVHTRLCRVALPLAAGAQRPRQARSVRCPPAGAGRVARHHASRRLSAHCAYSCGLESGLSLGWDRTLALSPSLSAGVASDSRVSRQLAQAVPITSPK